jgi:hypothetical protein
MIYFRAGPPLFPGPTKTQKIRGAKIYLGDPDTQGYQANYPGRRIRKAYYKTETGVEIVYDSWCLRRHVPGDAWHFDYIPATQHVNEGWIFINNYGFYEYRNGITTKIGTYTARDLYSRCFYAHGSYWAWDRFIYRYPWYPNIPARLLRWDGSSWIEIKNKYGPGTYDTQTIDDITCLNEELYTNGTKPYPYGIAILRYSGSGDSWTIFSNESYRIFSNGNSLYGTDGNIYRYSSGSWVQLGGYLNNVNDVIDINGTYYCATSNGLFQLVGSAWSQITTLRAPDALQLCEKDGKLIYSKIVGNIFAITEAIPQYRRTDGTPEQLDMHGWMYCMKNIAGEVYLSGNTARNIYSNTSMNAIYKIVGKLS